ncbi:MAG: nicotinate-nucleotide adenylyltransferase [Rhodospirillales bacterium]|nr:MAG: nicotinate-nucleotide adenylyltransferase [Rhodospirillales bacterium]
MKRVGLLGGSFNPAHQGHRHISVEAWKRLQLHEVWWLVTPGNPLKEGSDVAPLAERCARAEAVAAHGRIRVTDLERRLGTVHTADTLAALQRRFRDVRFVWLMGADNMVQIPRWRRWRRVFERVPVAVFPRPSYSFRAALGKAAQVYGHARVPESRAGKLAGMRPPAWTFLHFRPHPASATRIRARHGGDWGSP